MNITPPPHLCPPPRWGEEKFGDLSPGEAACEMLSFPQNQSEKSHADKDAIPHLSEIGSPGIDIYLRVDLIHPWKGVEDDDLLSKPLEKLPIDDIAALDPFII